MAHVTKESLQQWQEYEERDLLQARKDALDQYERAQSIIPKEHLPRLQKARDQRMLSISDSGADYLRRLQRAYEYWCIAQGLPTLVIFHPRKNSHIARVLFDLSSIEPDDHFDVFCPDLDVQDEQFHCMMLLCNEYSMSPSHVSLRHVFRQNAEEVAQRLLAFYDRMRMAREQEVQVLLATMSNENAASRDQE